MMWQVHKVHRNWMNMQWQYACQRTIFPDIPIPTSQHFINTASWYVKLIFADLSVCQGLAFNTSLEQTHTFNTCINLADHAAVSEVERMLQTFSRAFSESGVLGLWKQGASLLFANNLQRCDSLVNRCNQNNSLSCAKLLQFNLMCSCVFGCGITPKDILTKNLFWIS